MELALWECARLWPSITQPDVVLSLGTGTEAEIKTPRSPKAPVFRHLLNDGFIPRLVRSFMSSLDGEHAWKSAVNRLDSNNRANYFRLNVTFQGAEPRLDDMNCMDALRHSVYLQPQLSKDRNNVASALLVACFYFELDGLPTFESGQYCCRGTIRCRNDFLGVFRALVRLYSESIDFTLGTQRLGPLDTADVCKTCNIFAMGVQFNTRQLDDIIIIYLRLNDLERRKISGFPHSIQWYVEQQRLDAPFGTVFHDRGARWRCQACAVHLKNHRSLDTGVKRKLEKSHLNARKRLRIDRG